MNVKHAPSTTSHMQMVSRRSVAITPDSIQFLTLGRRRRAVKRQGASILLYISAFHLYIYVRHICVITKKHTTENPTRQIMNSIQSQ